MDDDLLSLVRKQVPAHVRKQILKAGLKGIADLHSRDIVHLGKSACHISGLLSVG